MVYSGAETRPERARDEIFIALGLLVQSIVPACTIGARGFVLWVEIFRENYPLTTSHQTHRWLIKRGNKQQNTITFSVIKVPPVISTFTEHTALLTVGLNTLASILFIKAFRVEFMKIFCRHK